MRFSAKVVPKKHVLASPQSFTDRPIIILETTPGYLSSLRRFAHEHDMDNLEITMEEYPQEWTERAKNFMFHVRDEIAIAQNGLQATQEDKDTLYHHAKRECGLKHSDGSLMSLNELSREELWRLTHLLLDWAAEEPDIDTSQFVEERRRLDEDK